MGRWGVTYCGTIRRKKSNIYRFLGGENVSRADRSSMAENERGDASRPTTRPRGKRGRIYIYIYIGQLTLRILGIFMKERLETFIPFRSP